MADVPVGHSNGGNDIMFKRKKLRLEDFDYTDKNHVYFLTLCATKHNPFLISELSIAIVDSLIHLKNSGDLALYCYCLMPDHLHLMLSPRGKSTSKLVQEFKSFTTKLAWKYGIKGKLWQRSYYDHIARGEENLIKICEYILHNPVRAGLVETANDWPYSGLIDDLPW